MVGGGALSERGVLAARILAVARDEFAANGYQGTSIRAIARGADVDPGLVYHYYGGKEALLAACVQAPPAMLDRIREAWQTPAEALGTALVTVTLANWSDSDSSAFLRTMVLTAAHHADTRAVLRGLVQTIGTDADDARRRASRSVQDFTRNRFDGLLRARPPPLRLLWIRSVRPLRALRDGSEQHLHDTGVVSRHGMLLGDA